MNNLERSEIAKGVSFNFINDKRFNTGKISVYFLFPLKEETAAANALLIQVLSRSCAKYSDFQSLNKHLGRLYGANISAYTKKLGEVQLMAVSISGLDDRYTLNGEKTSADLTKLLCELIFNPKLENGAFCIDEFEQEKRQLIDAIDADYNEKRIYAINRMTQEMCKNERFGLRSYGTKESVEALTPDDIFKAWQNLLIHAKIEIMMIGSSDKISALQIFAEKFSKLDREITPFDTNVIYDVEEIKDIKETDDVTQSKLVMGFRSGISALDKEEVPALKLMTAVLGGTPQSKFFVNVREKYSLCYYCAARCETEKGIIMIDSGIENENVDKAKKEILRQIELLQNGELTDFELTSTKMSIINSYKTLTDSVNGIDSWYACQTTAENMKSPQEAAEEINAVTAEQVINAAKKMKLDTVYLLTSKDA